MADIETFSPRNPDYVVMVKEAFDAQKAMALIGASLESVEPGAVEIALDAHTEVESQYPGMLHGGVVGMLADSALGFAALSLQPPGGAGVTAEYKVNMLRPAAGRRFVARGWVVRPGARVIAAAAEIHAIGDDGQRKLVATALGTLIPLEGS